MAAGGYVGYILLSYYRIGDIETSAAEPNNKDLILYGGNASGAVKLNESYTATTYNVGFGAYSQDYTFFPDEGYDEEGKLGTDAFAYSDHEPAKIPFRLQ